MEFCDYKVKENDYLELVLERYFVSEGLSSVDAKNTIYSAEGILEKVKEINDLYSVNLIPMNTVIKVPCVGGKKVDLHHSHTGWNRRSSSDRPTDMGTRTIL